MKFYSVFLTLIPVILRYPVGLYHDLQKGRGEGAIFFNATFELPVELPVTLINKFIYQYCTLLLLMIFFVQ